MAQMKEQNKTPENWTKQNRDSQPIRCRVQNTGNQDAQRNSWVGLQNILRSEGYENEIKENIQGTISGGEEAGIQINNLEHKEEISLQLQQQEEKRI